MDTRIFVGDFNTGTISAAPRELRRLQARHAALRGALLAELSQRGVHRACRRSTRPSRAATRTSSTATACRCAPWSACAPTRSCRSSTTSSVLVATLDQTESGVQGRFDAQGVSFANAQKPRPALPRRLPMGAAALTPTRAALLEALDRDGLVRQAWRDRALAGHASAARSTTTVVLTDPHVAAHHASVDLVPATDGRGADSLAVTAGDDEQRPRRRPRAHRRRQRPKRSPTPAATSTCTSAATRCACACPAMRSAPEQAIDAGRSPREMRWLPTARPGAGGARVRALQHLPRHRPRRPRPRSIGSGRAQRHRRRRALVRLLGAAVEDLHPAEPLRLACARVRDRQPGARSCSARCRRCSRSRSPGRGSPTSPSSPSIATVGDDDLLPPARGRAGAASA